MKSFWNQRYGAAQYAYGVEPNKFYKEQLIRLKPGKILFPGEGEGRNAVYAATLGWEVTAFDSTENGKIKADMLADLNEVKIDYILDDAEDVILRKNYFDCIVFIFVHLPAEKRRLFHRKMMSKLNREEWLFLKDLPKSNLNLTQVAHETWECCFQKKKFGKIFLLKCRN